MSKTGYSKLERNISKILSNFPFAKKISKYFIQIINLIIYKKKYSFKSISKVHLISPFNNDKNESFFGYYDKSPLNNDNKYIIYHSTNYSTRLKPRNKKKVEIYLYDITTNTHIHLTDSYAFNWQIGSRLQWINNKKFIYNDYSFKSKNYVSKIFNLDQNQIEQVFELPIYDCYQDKFALTLNFLTFNKYENAYSYNAHKIENTYFDSKNEIKYLDLKNAKSKTIIDIKKIISLKYLNSMEDSNHVINHIMISPDGSKFLFIHRWFKKGVRFERLILSDISGLDIKIIADERMVSHYSWITNYKFVGYLRINTI